MINNIRIKNYKSLKNFEMNLLPLNVFIGPNNTGKSNILSAFSFFQKVISISPWYQPWKDAGFNRIMHGFEDIGEISFGFNFSIKNSESDDLFEYNIAFQKTEDAIKIKSEHLSQNNIILIDVNYGTGFYLNNKKEKVNVGIDAIVLSFLQTLRTEKLFHEIYKYINDWLFSNVVPSIIIKEISEPETDYLMKYDGTNFDCVLDSISRMNVKAFTKITDFLKISFKEFDNLQFSIYNKILYLWWVEKPFDHMVSKSSLSDGVIKILQLLALIYNPVNPYLIAIEEPENYIHPGLLQRFAEEIRELSKRSQILITTHSPVLVEFMPEESLIMVDKEEGATVWQRFSSEKEEIGEYKGRILKGLWGR